MIPINVGPVEKKENNSFKSSLIIGDGPGNYITESRAK
jgi:hypothetical protein